MTTGIENGPQSTAQVLVFHVPIATQRGMTEMVVSALAKDANYSALVGKVGFPVYTDARRGIMPDIGGKWTKQKYEIREGEVIKVFCKKKDGFQDLGVNVAAYFRIRSTGPLIKVRVKLLGKQDSAMSYVEIIGRMDELPLQDVIALGANVPAAFQYMANPVYRNGFVEITEMERETMGKSQIVSRAVETPTGEKKVFTRTRPARQINI